jgi:hypothetical protein
VVDEEFTPPFHLHTMAFGCAAQLLAADRKSLLRQLLRTIFLSTPYTESIVDFRLGLTST